MSPVVVVAVLAGLALVAGTWVAHARKTDRALAERLDLPVLDDPITAEPAEPRRVAEWATGFAGRLVERLDRSGSLADSLSRARIPLRSGEYVIVTLAASLVLAVLLQTVTGAALCGLAALAIGPFVSRFLLRRRIRKRRKAFETQLPGAMTLIASSLAAGHTFLRAMQMMCEESEPPLSEEFARVVAESRLGDPAVEAMDRMAQRLQIRDLDWVVQAIRIQQTVGGRLADLLHTLADFIRARDEVRQEVMVLTAEGRISAWVLGAMVPLLFLAIQVVNPTYMEPMFQGWGPVVLGGCGTSVALGMVLILRMVKIDV